jgi:regulator of protease activity HflC (stomatin/prohibitin superfamily)
MKLSTILIALIVIIFIGFKTMTFVVTEADQAIIIQFGKPVGVPITEP